MKLILILILTLPLTCSAEIYKWTDENGRVHFGDKPTNQEASERIEVRTNLYESAHTESSQPHSTQLREEVIMFSTSWCGYCKQARSYFSQKGIHYIERDIEKDAHAKRQYDSIGGNGVPVILVGNKRMNGFSIPRFEEIYK